MESSKLDNDKELYIKIILNKNNCMLSLITGIDMIKTDLIKY